VLRFLPPLIISQEELAVVAEQVSEIFPKAG
jgi:acetylornithine/succinyldiaminopimelate/putrescine aminotransferase